MKSKKEESLERKILHMLDGRAKKLAELLFTDPEIQHLQNYANNVSIKRLGFNDHGPVHMRKVVLNAVTMLDILQKAGVQLNLEKEEIGDFEDSKAAVLLASFLHDLGMSIGRERHEQMSIMMCYPVIDRLLTVIYGDDLEKRVIVRSLAIEGIAGHMATQKIHSLEAGLILVADGCDMEKGRARIPMMLNTESRVGDIHKYSSASIEEVQILPGENKPLRINIIMSASVGFFQVEEVLLGKINVSPVKQYIELYAWVKDREVKRYL